MVRSLLKVTSDALIKGKGKGHPVTFHWRYRGGSGGIDLPTLNLGV